MDNKLEMGGGLMQLVAYGAQDVYLTGNPQITFFKVMYRRHTHFSLESIEQTFNGQVAFGKKITATISRNGDLIHRMYLRVDIPSMYLANTAAAVAPAVHGGVQWVDNLGHALIKTVDIEIGGQRIDRQYGEWLHVWNELTQAPGHQIGYNSMIGMHPKLTTKITPNAAGAVAAIPAYTMYIPLAFWFNRNPGLALPLIALQYHEIKINFEFRSEEELVWITPAVNGGVPATRLFDGSMNAQLYVDYIYMDTDERRRFAQVTHEYLIEQVQFSGAESIVIGGDNAQRLVKLQLNHPCKELIFMISDQARLNEKKYFDFSTGVSADLLNIPNPPNGGFNAITADGLFGAKNPIKKVALQLNGHDRFSERDGMYFNMVQPYQHHSNTPSAGINVYSFALKPEEHQPSGTCNMSRIDNASLRLTLEALPAGGLVWVFATNYNVLRIMSGMGGLAYSS
jgi:Major capsid protein N-terminus/Large eukaryotic DNA virus major capsid protein